MDKYYGISYAYGDHWNSIVVKIIDAPVNVDTSLCESVYVKWSDYHRDYIETDEETNIEVYLLPCFDESSKIDVDEEDGESENDED